MTHNNNTWTLAVSTTPLSTRSVSTKASSSKNNYRKTEKKDICTRKMAENHTTEIVVSSLLFAVFFICYILVLYFCKCRKQTVDDESDLEESLAKRKAYSPEPEEREAMIRRSLREKNKKREDSIV